ncbi:MAG: N-acyl-D-amino-acid deacylase [Candidatus Moranbacteria bacterium GW2011_GWA2_39_41]|nr:MAG: N-acyl-D-amino-acid deacylase [Candidatus Moranbacteria bacterium GW2011_GWA2_39_41]
MFDIIIKNGTLIDGSGRPMYRADIGIKDDRIAKIGDLHNEKSDLEIDASQRLVCPGFVDVNNHSDTYWQIFANPKLESLINQGITTIVGGNCGASLAPLLGAKAISSVQKWANVSQTSLDWLTVEEFLDVVEKKKLSVNFATLVGQATLRRSILDDDMRNLNSKEVDFLAGKLATSMKDGALGMSSGLVYSHARSTTTDELVNLAQTIVKYNGVYVTHMRNENSDIVAATEEAIEIARKSKVKLHISHLKVMGEKNWGMMDGVLDAISRANEVGLDVSFDVFPYTNTGSVLYTLLPNWVVDGGKKMMLSRLKDPETRAKVLADMSESGIDYSKIEIAISPLNKTLARRKISEIATSQEKTIEDTVIDILLASEGRVIISLDVLSEENIAKAIVHPASMISTNGSGYADAHAKTGEIVHPRSFGTFPRIFSKYVLGKRIISWEDAVKKMTSVPAQKFGIERRGELKEKYFADIVIINRDEIRDMATPENPYQYNKGIDFVLVNGQIALQDGIYNNGRNGRVIRR